MILTKFFNVVRIGMPEIKLTRTLISSARQDIQSYVDSGQVYTDASSDIFNSNLLAVQTRLFRNRSLINREF